MKKLALVGALAVAACTPDIPQTAPQDHAIVAFNPAGSPPVVPSPNDLAIDPATGKVNAPVDPNSSAANQEFTTDYLNTLDGFPAATAAAAQIEGGDLDPATVNASTVLVNDLTAAATGGNPQVAGVTPVYDPASHQLVVPPPNGAWTKGHKYEVVVVSGQGQGVQVQGGGQLYGSVVWSLARSPDPLVECQGDACRSLNSLVSDPNQAKQLEQLRLGYAPLLDALQAAGISRNMVPALWTFTITSQPEMRFDPANSVIPFPNNLVTKPLADGGVQVNLPYPDGGILPDGGVNPANSQAMLIMGLNTLDGFSTTAPIVSENSDDQAALTDGAKIDPATISPQTAAVIPLVDAKTLPPQNIQPCVLPDMPGCATDNALPDGGYDPMPDGGALPQQLQFIPVLPLQEHTPYGAFVTTNVKAQGGKNVAPTTAFALMRLANPLLDSSNHSTIPGVSDAEAQQLEPIRAALKPFFDALDAQGLHRKDLALAWNFNTESTASILQQLHGVTGAASVPLNASLVNADAAFKSSTPNNTNIGHIYWGDFTSVDLLTGPGGTLNPSGPAPKVHPFLLITPSALASGQTSWPVVVFGHGLTRSRFDALALAGSLATAGYATIAMDNPWHGDRTTCVGTHVLSSAVPQDGTGDALVACTAQTGFTAACDAKLGRCVATDRTAAAACTFGTATGDFTCFAAGQGRCQTDNKCDGADFKRGSTQTPNVSGWNFFNVQNLFATRDNFRQQMVDWGQLERVVKDTSNTSISAQLAAPTTSGGQGDLGGLNGDAIQYSGQSLGGILGTLETAASPNVHDSVLNVPAGDLIRIFLTTPDPKLGQLLTAFKAGLAAQGIQDKTPAFDSFLGLGHMILDPADPVNAGHPMLVTPAPSDRQVFIQYIQDDQLLPNPTTEELIAATIRSDADDCAKNSGATPCATAFQFNDQTCANTNCVMPTLAKRHGFLLEGTTNATGDAQAQLAAFLLGKGVVTPWIP